METKYSIRRGRSTTSRRPKIAKFAMKLFGGAVTADVPNTLVDASDLREIPDNQEVFVGVIQNYSVSIIIELLEAVKHPNLVEALAVHVEEAHRMANVPECDREDPLEVTNMRLGSHMVASRTDVVLTEGGRTLLLFSLIRLEEYETDVLITCTVSQDGTIPSEKELGSQRGAVLHIAETLEIVDPGLFKTTPHNEHVQVSVRPGEET